MHYKLGYTILLLLCVLSTLQPAQAKNKVAQKDIMAAIKAKIDSKNLPKHVAIIMDGNGRWAAKRGQQRTFGHKNAIQSVREAVESCVELNIPYLTLYAFSLENWKRPSKEVAGMMKLIVTTVDNELTELTKNNVRLNFVGDLKRLPKACQEAITRALEASKHNQGLYLTIALSYSGQWDIVQAASAIAQKVQAGTLQPDKIDIKVIRQHLATDNIPDIDLLIRTSGEHRLSNFLLWHLAYTELFFSPVLWPDFKKNHFYKAILAYQKRSRRFGSVTS